MYGEWQRITYPYDCYVSRYGDVEQNGVILKPHLHGETQYRWVTLSVLSREYHEGQDIVWVNQETTVWELMRLAWFINWPSDSDLYFVDHDPWNCSVDNIRLWNRRRNRMISVREEGGQYIFDGRLRGEVEIVELNKRCSGVAEAARIVGGSQSGVSLVLSGALETHKKFHFRWV